MEENCYAGGVMNEHEKSEITFDIVCEYGKLVETVFVRMKNLKRRWGNQLFCGRFWSMGKSYMIRLIFKIRS